MPARTGATCSPMPPVNTTRSQPPSVVVIAAIPLATDRQKHVTASRAVAVSVRISSAISDDCPETPSRPHS